VHAHTLGPRGGAARMGGLHRRCANHGRFLDQGGARVNSRGKINRPSVFPGPVQPGHKHRARVPQILLQRSLEALVKKTVEALAAMPSRGCGPGRVRLFCWRLRRAVCPWSNPRTITWPAGCSR